MKISILIPVKNASEWIEETLNSIRAQSYDQWEILAVDDHSDDNSFAILAHYATNDPRIRCFKNEVSGIIPTLQLALQHASGECITRMDADDLMPPDRLKILADQLRKKGPGHVVTGLVRYFPEPVSEGYRKYESWLNERVINQDHGAQIFRECVLSSPNWMLFRSDVDKHNLFDNLNYPEDYDLTFRMHAAGLQFVGIDALTLLWREHPLRTSRNSEVYQQESFFQLKLEWYFRLNMNESKPLALFGAGVKGKIVARYLLKEKVNFRWYDLNAEKYGAGIFGQTIHSSNTANEPYAIVCVYPERKEQLEESLASLDYTIGKNAWYF